MSSPTPDFEATDAVVQGLLASWDDYASQATIKTKGKSVPQVILSLGLASHVHRLARPAFDMLRQGLVLESVPTLRAMFEAAVTAHWAVQVPDAVDGFALKDRDQRRWLLDAMYEMGPDFFGKVEHRQAIAELDAITIPEGGASARFATICKDLNPPEMFLYSQYRLLSQMTHPSDLLLDSYFHAIDSPPGFAIHRPPKQPNRNGLASLGLASLIWAGQAVEYSNPNRERRPALREAAKTLSISATLTATSSAMARQSKAARHRATAKRTARSSRRLS
jgi:hypothetical protein